MTTQIAANTLAKVSKIIGKVALKIYPDACYVKQPTATVDARGGVSESFAADPSKLFPCFAEGMAGKETIRGEKVAGIEQYRVTFPAQYQDKPIVLTSKDRLYLQKRDTRTSEIILEIVSINRTDGVETEVDCVRVYE